MLMHLLLMNEIVLHTRYIPPSVLDRIPTVYLQYTYSIPTVFRPHVRDLMKWTIFWTPFIINYTQCAPPFPEHFNLQN